VLPGRRNGKHLPRIPRRAGRHGLVVAGPVPGSQTLRDDEIQRLADGLRGPIAEHGFGAGVPQTDDAVAIREDDRVVRFAHDVPPQPRVRVWRLWAVSTFVGAASPSRHSSAYGPPAVGLAPGRSPTVLAHGAAREPRSIRAVVREPGSSAHRRATPHG